MGDGPTTADRQRLGKAVADRRAELGRPQGDLAAHGGPSARTIRSIEQATLASYTPAMLAKLDAGLDWPAGTAQRHLTGAQPTDLRLVKPYADGDDLRLIGRNGKIWSEYISGDTQEAIGARYGIHQVRVSQIIAEVRRSIPEEDKEARRQRYAEQLDRQSVALEAIIAAGPIPAYSNGRPILLADGETIAEDRTHIVTAMREQRAIQKRAAEMFGLDAAAKVQNAHTFEVTPELQERLDAARLALADNDD